MKLNDSRAEIIPITSAMQCYHMELISIKIGKEVTVPKLFAEYHGATLDSSLSIEHQVSSATNGAYYNP